MMNYKRIDHLALHVSDLRTSVAFYETHFGFKIYFEHQTPTGLDIAYLCLGDTVLELTGRADPPLNGFHFCLETDDFEGAVASLKDAGVEMATQPHKTAAREAREANWRRVVFKGPDGESIEIRG
jgi:lactoylglutathione lyase